MSKFYCLQRDFQAKKPEEQFSLHDVRAVDQEDAWEVIEEQFSSNNSQEWLMTEGELKALEKCLKEAKL